MIGLIQTFRRAVPAILPMLAILVLTVSGCSEHDPEGDDAPGGQHEDDHEAGVVELAPEMLERFPIRSADVVLRVLPAELLTTGEVDFEQDRLAHVTPRIPGRVATVHADLGEEIAKGQVLAVVDSIELGRAKSDYLQARAHEELASQNFEREKGLFAEGITPEKEMLVARAAHLEALARLRNSEQTLRLYGVTKQRIEALSYDDGETSLLPVRSPLSGRVVEKHVTVGEMVTPERNMFTIADLGHVWIWIDVYEQDLRNVHLEDDVSVAVDALPDELFGGKVSYLSDQVDAHTRTVRARIDADNPEYKLRPGMFARVTLSDPHFDSEGLAPSLVVPAEAVQRDGAKFVVFEPLDDHRFRRHEVVVGRRAGGFVEIVSGLGEARSVVVEGTFLLKSEASKAEMGGGHGH